MIDYASPLINIEYMTRMVHNLCLERKYDTGKDVAVQLAAEVKMLINTLTHMHEEQRKADRGFIQSQ